jgi:flagellar secretion chaperone FliS
MMYSPGQSGAGAYAQVGLQTGVVDASPHRLIVMLFQGARQAIARARLHLQRGDVGEKGLAISRAIRIIGGGLQQSLNVDEGGAIAQRLDSLYSYMTRRLMQANLEQSEQMLIEVDGLLATLEDAWLSIAPEHAGRVSTSRAVGS